MQTVYVSYVAKARPHTEYIFNRLEFFNEGMITLMCYLMVVYTGVGDATLISTATLPLALSAFISGVVATVNIGVMILMTIPKLRQKWAARSESKRRVEALKLLAAGKKLKAGELLKPGLAFAWLHPPAPLKPKPSIELATPLAEIAEIVEESKEEPVEEKKEEVDVLVESYEYVDEERILENLKEAFGIKEEPRSRK